MRRQRTICLPAKVFPSQLPLTPRILAFRFCAQPPKVVRFPDQEAERIFTPRDAAKTILKAMSKNYAQ